MNDEPDTIGKPHAVRDDRAYDDRTSEREDDEPRRVRDIGDVEDIDSIEGPRVVSDDDDDDDDDLPEELDLDDDLDEPTRPGQP